MDSYEPIHECTPEQNAAFEQLLLRHILGAPRGAIKRFASHEALVLDKSDIAFYQRQVDDLVPTDSIPVPEGGDYLLLTIRPTHVRSLGATPQERFLAIEHQLENRELAPGFDYNLLAVLETVNPHGIRSLSEEPIQYMISVDSHSFSCLAMDVLRKLADPAEGMKLIGGQYDDREKYAANRDHYVHQFISPNNPLSQLVSNMVANARFSAADVRELADIANHHDNFDFAKLVEADRANFAGRVRRGASARGA